MRIIQSPEAMSAWSSEMTGQGKSIALVPTMGYFHQGHLALMRLARQHADFVVVSLFVNPIQFAPTEDLSSYPRNKERDTELAENEGVAVLFTPDVEQMYPAGSLTRVEVRGLTDPLCGASRTGHFEGVTTVVAKLFNIVRPQAAIFGEKDFQQLAVIRKMTTDLNFNLTIVAHPIVREPDGLAMSSRNTYLSSEERKKALCLFRAITLARKLVGDGERDPRQVTAAIHTEIMAAGGVEIDYVSLVDCNNLTCQPQINRQTQLAMAVRIGRTRLIDNDCLGKFVQI